MDRSVHELKHCVLSRFQPRSARGADSSTAFAANSISWGLLVSCQSIYEHHTGPRAQCWCNGCRKNPADNVYRQHLPQTYCSVRALLLKDNVTALPTITVVSWDAS